MPYYSGTFALYFTPNFEEEKGLPLLWEVIKQRDDYKSRFKVYWFGILFADQKQRLLFFHQSNEFTSIQLRKGIAYLKKDVYSILYSLQDFLDQLMNKQEASWIHPHSSYYRKIEGVIQDESYQFLFTAGQGEHERHREVTVFYQDIKSTSDLLFFLNESFSKFLDPNALTAFSSTKTNQQALHAQNLQPTAPTPSKNKESASCSSEEFDMEEIGLESPIQPKRSPPVTPNKTTWIDQLEYLFHLPTDSSKNEESFPLLQTLEKMLESGMESDLYSEGEAFDETWG